VTLLFQEATHAAVQDAAHGAAAVAHGTFEPTLLGWIVLLPLLGFVVNGIASLIAARRALPPVAALGHDHAHDASEQERHADDHLDHPATPTPDAHALDTHDVHDEPRGWTHTLPSFVAPGVLLAAFALALINFFGMLGAELHEPIVRTYWSWMPVGDLQVDAALHLDSLSMLMTLIITGVGSLIHIFSVGYMRQDPGYPRYMAYLNLFVFFMLVLVLGASYPLMFVGWEGVGLCSYLLIGFWFTEKANADAGKKAFIVNRIGDFGFLIAMFLLFVNLGADAGSLAFVDVMRDAPLGLEYAGPVVTAIALFLFLGAAGKSAQIPLYVWLPDAMAGPTPVSALIHAATMVTAGVYLVVRSSVLFTMAPSASLVVALVGALTAIFAATIGLKQWDIKKVLAYSTVSQLGFMFAAVGMGAYVAGVFHLMTHAFFKACLFLGSGAVIHAMHHALHATHSGADAQDMRNMGGLRRYMPVTFATMGIATLAIAGVPPFAGFFSKDEIIGAALIGAEGGSAFSQAYLFGIPGNVVMGFIWGTLSITALLTAFYMGRLMLYTFFGPNRAGEPEQRHLHEVGPSMTIPLIVLAVLSTVGGWLNIDPHVPIAGLFAPLGNLFGGELALHHWLEPVVEPAAQVAVASLGELPEVAHHGWAIGLAIAIAFGGLALAYFLLKPAGLRRADQQPSYTTAAGGVLYNKWFIDELYDRVVVRPLYAVSRAFYSVVDRGIIDGVIDGAGRLTQSVGLLAGRIQTGQLNTYAFTIVVGVLVVLGAFVAL
jgi:NADH-quinone oxidoreductase subunit L